MAGTVKVKGFTRRDGVKVKGHTRKTSGRGHRKHKRMRGKRKTAHKRIMKSPAFRSKMRNMMKSVHRKAGTRKRRRRA